ncbi:MAG: uroporphyrinogen-III synthase [Rhizobiales bacterium]|nr:uroporphyrinogen-III synthase [Hyphomicrobiales bacterium]
MRVLVTRPEPEASRTAEELARRGHDAVIAPLLLVDPLVVPASAAIPAGAIAALAVTSPRTAGLIAPENRTAWAHLPVFSVGDRTAAAMSGAGFRDVRSAAGDIRALGRLIVEAGLAPGTCILSLGGEERAGDLAGLVAAAGLNVVEQALYRMTPVIALPAPLIDALAATDPLAALHYSPRSAATFAQLVATAGLGAGAGHLTHLCLSEAVAGPLRGSGHAAIRVAARPDEAALLALLGH